MSTSRPGAESASSFLFFLTLNTNNVTIPCTILVEGTYARDPGGVDFGRLGKYDNSVNKSL